MPLSAVASRDDERHSSVMRTAAFSSFWDKVKAAKRGEDLSKSLSVTLIPTPWFTVPELEDLSVQTEDWTCICLLNNTKEMVASWEPPPR